MSVEEKRQHWPKTVEEAVMIGSYLGEIEERINVVEEGIKNSHG